MGRATDAQRTGARDDYLDRYYEYRTGGRRRAARRRAGADAPPVRPLRLLPRRPGVAPPAGRGEAARLRRVPRRHRRDDADDARPVVLLRRAARGRGLPPLASLVRTGRLPGAGGETESDGLRPLPD